MYIRSPLLSVMYLYSVYIIQSTDIYPSLDTSLPQTITTPSFRIRIYANGPFWRDSLTVNSFPDFLHYLFLFVYKTSINSFSRGSSPCQSCFPETTLTRFSPSCGSSCHTDYSLRTFFIFFNPDFSSPLVQYIPEQSELFLPPPLVTSETLCLPLFWRLGLRYKSCLLFLRLRLSLYGFHFLT